MFIGMLFALAIAAVLVVLPFWRIFSKAGYSGAMSLLMLVPLANIVMLFVLAFSEWPAERELNQLRAQVYPQQYPPQGYPPQYPQQNYPPQPQGPQPPKYPER